MTKASKTAKVTHTIVRGVRKTPGIAETPGKSNVPGSKKNKVWHAGNLKGPIKSLTEDHRYELNLSTKPFDDNVRYTRPTQCPVSH